ncbi:MAG: hypothetical protein K2Q34_05495, partial [Alphaproteobacteria bacterium]|nr:hypothetical protein [Alphaproteobacteria bacterium]
MFLRLFRFLFVFFIFTQSVFSIIVMDVDTFHFMTEEDKRTGVRFAIFNVETQAYETIEYHYLSQKPTKDKAKEYRLTFSYKTEQPLTIKWHPLCEDGVEFSTTDPFSLQHGCVYRIKTQQALDLPERWNGKNEGGFYIVYERDLPNLDLESLTLRYSNRTDSGGFGIKFKAIEREEADVSVTFSNISLAPRIKNVERRILGELAARLTFLRPSHFNFVDVKIEEDHNIDGVFINHSHKRVIFTESKSWRSKSKGGPEKCWAAFLGIDTVATSLKTLQEKRHSFWDEFSSMLQEGYIFSGLYHFIQENGEGIFYLRSYKNDELLERAGISLSSRATKKLPEIPITPVKISSQQLRGFFSTISPESFSKEEADKILADFFAGKLLATPQRLFVDAESISVKQEAEEEKTETTQKT